MPCPGRLNRRINRRFQMRTQIPWLVAAWWCLALELAAQSAIYNEAAITHPVVGYGGMVATQEAHATRAAVEVLAEGGNAVDAAVTAGFTLAVTLPRAGNLGGGGFMLVHLAGQDEQVAIDYRERAPLAASRDMFLDDEGKVVTGRSRRSHLAAGVPGTVRGLVLALEKFGTIPLRRALAPAIRLAEEGFTVTEDLSTSLEVYAADLRSSPAAAEIFLRPDGSAWPVGSTLVQKDLASSLRLIAEGGADAFYRGPIARAIAADMAQNAGFITGADLAAYRAVIREPVRGSYRGMEIVSMPPPSSGGVHLIQMLNVLERFPVGRYGHNSADAIHLTAEVMRRAYADRSHYLGDPDFVDVPTGELIAKAYAEELAGKIDLRRATTPLPTPSAGLSWPLMCKRENVN